MAKQMCYGRAAEEDYDWYDMLGQYMEVKAKYKRNPKCSGGGEKEKRLYYWMYNQTRLIKEGHMSKEHMIALVKAGVDIPNKGNLYEKYVKSVQKFRNLTLEGFTLNKRMYNWALIQARDYNEHNMAQWKIEIWQDHADIQSIESFGLANEEWLRMHKRCAASMPLTKDSDEEFLLWFNRQLDHMYAGKLYDWQVRYMENSGFPQEKIEIPAARDIAFEENCMIYEKFVKENGKKPGTKTLAEKKLQQWAADQRRRMKMGKKTPEQVERLKSLGIVLKQKKAA